MFENRTRAGGMDRDLQKTIKKKGAASLDLGHVNQVTKQGIREKGRKTRHVLLVGFNLRTGIGKNLIREKRKFMGGKIPHDRIGRHERREGLILEAFCL